MRIEDLAIAIKETLSGHAVVLGRMAILLRNRTRIPTPDLSGLSRLDSELAESADLVSSQATGTEANQERRQSLAHRSRRRMISEDEKTIVGGPEEHPPLYWSKFIVDGRSTEIFRLYSDVLFDFIIETWPSDATIGYTQLRDFALYMGMRDVPPPEDWVKRHSKCERLALFLSLRSLVGMLCGHAFSTEPLRSLFDTCKVEYLDRTIKRRYHVYKPGAWRVSSLGSGGWAPGIIELKEFDDSAPVLEKAGWHQLLSATLQLDPSNWFKDHQAVSERLPQEYRRLLPRGHIPREALPASAACIDYVPLSPLPRDTAGYSFLNSEIRNVTDGLRARYGSPNGPTWPLSEDACSYVQEHPLTYIHSNFRNSCNSRREPRRCSSLNKARRGGRVTQAVTQNM